MKMGDGRFRPAYNVQYAVAGSETGGHRTIVGVNVTNVGSDMGSLAPMVEQIAERTDTCLRYFSPSVVMQSFKTLSRHASHVRSSSCSSIKDRSAYR